MRPDTARILMKAAAAAFLCVFAMQWFEARYGLNIWDEGFLWYGVQRVWAGEVPIRDFMAYDPGRYYWAAGIASLWGGHGILDIRVAVAIFQWVGLTSGLWALLSCKTRGRLVFLVLGATVLSAWMFPRHKLFDISLSIMLVALFSWWIAKPNIRRHFFVGAAIGLIACFGRNHGVYAVAGSALVFLWFWWTRSATLAWRHVFAWGAGIAAGFIPVGLACLLVPGFGSAFWASIMFLFELKATNLPLPVPWPWNVQYAGLSLEEGGRQFLIGMAFIGLVAFPIIAGFFTLRRRLNATGVAPALVAAVCLSIPYAHYAFSRADVGHLAQGIFPALVGLLVVLQATASAVRYIAAVTVLAASVWIVLPSHPAVVCVRLHQCEDVEVSHQRLVLDRSIASDVALIRQLSASYAPDGRSFFTTPLWPGAYALMERRSPVWEIYALTARNQAFQNAEIARLKEAKPGFVVVLDLPLDNREELRYKNTHPLIEKYVEDHFVPLPSTNAMYQIYRAPEGDREP